MRRVRGSVPLALLVLAALGASIPIALSQETGSTQIVIKTAPRAVIVDLRAPGFSAGDMVLMRGVAADAVTGEDVGRLTARCQRIRAAADDTWARLLCEGELSMETGKLTFSGSRMQGESYMTGRYAITGGTGAYAGAGGSVITEDDDARNKWTFDVIDLRPTPSP